MRERAAAGLHEQRIDMAVVAALEFHDLVAPGKSAREPDRGHRRLGAAVDHADFFNRRHPRADQLGHLDLARIRDAEADAVFCGGGNRIEHDLRRMAENRRPPCADVVDEFVAIDIPDVRAVGALDEERLAADAAKRAHG